MAIEVGAVLDGKVTGISKFGAFVQLEEGKSGMVHISEISNSYVTEIKDFLSEGQFVRVKVVGIDEKGRINLSIKKADAAAEDSKPEHRESFRRDRSDNFSEERRPKKQSVMTFEEMMSKFKQDSEARCADLKNSKENRKSNYSRRSQR